MKMPKTRKAFCPTCKKHTEHKVGESKQKTMGSAHPNSHGSRAQARHMARYGNHGSYSRPPIKRRKMYGKKQSKKTDLRFECTVCKKKQVIGSGWRAKKVEFV